MAWSKTGNMLGPKGDKGDTGDKGDPGEPAPSQVVGSLAGVGSELTLWVGSQDEYDQLGEFDPLTVYVVAE